MVPQRLLSIAAYLERESLDVLVYDCLGPRVPVNLKEQLKAILTYRQQIICFSTTTSSFLDAADLAQIIKIQSPTVITVYGGVHVSALEGRLLDEYP
jgi:anaerobic magnesium-protoporphyrin IX monomethyl ester cyclase